jgi:CubicO group peptidase (beta-lactamase class C family)
MHRYWAFVAVTLLAPGPAAAADPRAAVDKIVQPFRKDKPYLGLVVGVTGPDGHHVYGYGKVKLGGKSQPPGPDTLFEIGSITKVFTGTLLADQATAGVVRLDDPAQKHLPADWKVPRRDDRDITLLHLATHSSSLPAVPPILTLLALVRGHPLDPWSTFKQADLARALAATRLSRPIGCRFEYSNLGVGLLGHALAHAARAKGYEELLRQRVTGPLGMADTRITLTADQAARFPRCHGKDGKETPAWTFGCLEACGGLHSTVHDLLQFADANLGRRQTALDRAIRLAHETWRDTNSRDAYVGLCWMHEKLSRGGPDMVWHNGGTFGSRSFLGLVPKAGLGVVVLSNSGHPVDDLAIAILRKLAEAK